MARNQVKAAKKKINILSRRTRILPVLIATRKGIMQISVLSIRKQQKIQTTKIIYVPYMPHGRHWCMLQHGK